jgi:hypothetical protein
MGIEQISKDKQTATIHKKFKGASMYIAVLVEQARKTFHKTD